MNLFDLVAKITLDSSDYEKKLGDSEKKTKSFVSKLGGGIVKGVNAVGAATVAAGAAIGKVIYDSVSAYSEYEQLVGGVNKLFGDSATQIRAYAAEAYKTSGLSASQYMEQATSFSAALINSLDGDTAKAAELTDVAMRAISDNFNTFGGDISSVQNAFQGFAKQQYQLLDNLKLGYGGTKSEMERLISDANEYAASIGQASDLSIDSFADIVQAIELVQEKQGIAGTTAKEAATTIQGSLGMTKAAWQNLVTGLSDSEADVGQLVQNLISSAGLVAKNIIPTVKQALSGIGTAIAELAPEIGNGISGLVTDVLPDLVKSAIVLVKSFAKSLIDNVDAILDAAFEIIEFLAKELTINIPTLLPAVVEMVMAIANKLTSPDNLDMLIVAALDLVIALAEGIIAAENKLIEKAPILIAHLVEAIIKEVPRILLAAVELIVTFAAGIADKAQTLIDTGKMIVETVKNGLSQKIADAKTWGRDLIQNFINGITAKWQALKDKVKGVAQTVKNFLGFSEPKEGPLSNFHTYAPDMIDLFMKGISDNENKLKKQVAKSFDFSDMLTYSPDDMTFTDDFGGDLTSEEMTFESATDRKVDRLISIVSEYLPQLANMQIITDTGTLVGELAPGMDAALGRRAVYAARGNA